jgi:pyrroloquinoline quinone biosynthesis protein B
VQLVLLGTAAGGGFPQWNCYCAVCRVARAEPHRARPRSQSSAAVSADGQRWFLLNASPDVRDQLGRLPIRPPTGNRYHPVEGIVLSDAELDHTLGLVLLREGRQLVVYATAATLEVIQEDSRLLPVTGAFARVEVIQLDLDQSVPLCYRDGVASGLRVQAVAVAGDPPLFARHEHPGHTVGLILTDEQTGGRVGFFPGCGALDQPLLARLASLDLLLLDGTFWTDDEMIRQGLSERTARQMAHLPVSGPGGSLAILATLPCRRKVYTHINNSNPILVEDSDERRRVEAAGIEVAHDGMQFTL